MKHPSIVALLALSGVNLLGGCAPVIVGGAATGAVVATDTRTTGAFLDDEGIEIKSRLAILDDPALQDVHINVTSINGVVLLTGEAPTEAQRNKILDHVRVVPRVRRTVNEIRIAPATAYSSRMSDTLITTKVKSKMLGDEKARLPAHQGHHRIRRGVPHGVGQKRGGRTRRRTHAPGRRRAERS